MLFRQAVQCCRVGIVAIPLYRWWLRNLPEITQWDMVQESALLVVVF